MSYRYRIPTKDNIQVPLVSNDINWVCSWSSSRKWSWDKYAFKLVPLGIWLLIFGYMTFDIWIYKEHVQIGISWWKACCRKDLHYLAMFCRWLFYPPHKIPPGVKVSVDEYGSHHFDAPNPVRWLLEASILINILPKHFRSGSFTIFIKFHMWPQ